MGIAHTEVSREVAIVVREIAERYGPVYVEELLLPRLLQHLAPADRSEEEARATLCDPVGCLRAIFTEYAFARRGKDRHDLATMAVEALRRATQVTDLFSQPDGVLLWHAFQEVCLERGKKPMEQLNRGVVQGIAELAQEIHFEGGSGSIALWIVDAARKTGRIENQFMRIVDVRGAGPKLSSLLLRDIVYLFNLEDRIEPMDRLYFQPIDRWTRVIAEFVVQDYDDPADWILAGKLSKIARKSGAKGTLFNMGVAYYGTRVVHSDEAFQAGLAAMVQDGLTIARRA
ncbi:MAG: hypothetical protein QOJ65_1416 [Fimbriimonadaceae bacterium]|jgi:hypothetical protein|nr:hypothetical protein [Fimbriimonadaceae bacterium]